MPDIEEFKRELTHLLNRHSWDSQLNLSDHEVADLLIDVLEMPQDDNDALQVLLIFSDMKRRLERIERLLIHNLKNESNIMADLTQLTQDVAANNDAVQSAITLLGGLKKALDDAGTDPVKLKALSDSLEGNTSALAAAVVANTPSDPNASPSTEGSEADTSSPQG